MVSQFISCHQVGLLGDLDFDFPEGTHAIGRLDNHSEGLLILTTNKKVTRLLFQGVIPHKRTYLVQVKNAVLPETLHTLRTGIAIPVEDGKEYMCIPCEVDLIDAPADIFKPGNGLPVYPPFSWLRITLTEGKFHQVRKMVAAVRHRCLRLIRTSIEDLELGDLPAGGVLELGEEEFFKKLKIEAY